MKRIKIIFSLAVLALSVGVMAFGVYAATAVTYTVNNKVGFTVGSNFGITVSATASLLSGAPTFASTISGNSYGYTKAINETASPSTWAPSSFALTPTNNYIAWRIDFQNTTTSAKQFNVKVTVPAEQTGMTAFSIIVAYGSAKASTGSGASLASATASSATTTANPFISVIVYTAIDTFTADFSYTNANADFTVAVTAA